MKAPNGEQTRLNERQWVQVRTPAFKEWFGDWENDSANASKVVDENEEPMVVYHGTSEDFSMFKRGSLGSNTDGNASDIWHAMTSRVGFWFNSQPMASPRTGGMTGGGYKIDMPVFLSIKDPADMGSIAGLADDIQAVGFDANFSDSPTGAKRAASLWVKQLRVQDGVEISDREFGGRSWVALAPNQIKSAIGNTGQFSKDNNDIRYSRKPGTLGSDTPRPLGRKIDRYKELIQTLKDDKVDIYEKQKALEAHIKKALPPAERFRVIHLIKNIAKPATKEGREKALSLAIEKVEEAHQRKRSVIDRIMSDKEILSRRRANIKNIRDYLGLTDDDLKKVSRKDIRLMDNYEFKKFKDGLLALAVDFADHKQAKLELLDIIYRKQLRKVENLQKAMGMDPISKMTKEDLNTFAALLDQYEPGDTFLGKRELQTVDNTDLEGIKTWREAIEKLSEETGHSMEELMKTKLIDSDYFRWDTSLADRGPFFKLLVEGTTKELMKGQVRYLEVEDRLHDLAKKAEGSRSRGVIDRMVPTDDITFQYIESGMDEDIAAKMTPEQIEMAHFMSQYYLEALEYLKAHKRLEEGRENYFVHVRRLFLETWKDEGLAEAFKGIFKNYEQDQAVFNILDDDTSNILPLEKFFQFSMRRTGELTPTKNVVRAFLTYAKTFESMKAMDAILPKFEIYSQALTPETYTPRGLETDRSLKKFVFAWLNNKKGRRVSFNSIIRQGGGKDMAINGLRTFTTLLDLGLNIPVGIASFVGEQTTNYTMLGADKYAKGATRMATSKGKLILQRYRAFTGRTPWEEFNDPGKVITERLAIGMFGLFHASSVLANKQYLLGMITDKEYQKGEISDERLAQLKLAMGRFRVVPGTNSIFGSTSVGKAILQYKGWAVPTMRTTVKDIKTFSADIVGRKEGALTSTEARELYRIIGVSSTALLVISLMGDDGEDDFLSQIKRKAQREAMTLMQGMDPKLWLSVPRVLAFLAKLGENIHSAIMLEEYKNKEGLKGVEGLKKQFTPHIAKPVLKMMEDDE